MFAEATSTGYSFDRRDDSITDHRHRCATGDDEEESWTTSSTRTPHASTRAAARR
jgi:hypothetical protein